MQTPVSSDTPSATQLYSSDLFAVGSFFLHPASITKSDSFYKEEMGKQTLENVGCY